MPAKHFAKILKRLRKKRGLTQSELSELLGKSPGHIGMLEQGRSLPTYEMLCRLIEIFDVDANVFFEKGGDKASQAKEALDIIFCMEPTERQQLLTYLKTQQINNSNRRS